MRSFDLAEVSAGAPGPLVVRTYLLRQGQRALLSHRNSRSPFFSFSLPFIEEEDWIEESVVAFTCSHIQQQLASWAGALPSDFSPSQIAQGIGTICWLDSSDRFCLPVLLCFAETWEPPLIIKEWKTHKIAKALQCPEPYVSRWFVTIKDFRYGGLVLFLPPDSDSLDIKDGHPEAKR